MYTNIEGSSQPSGKMGKVIRIINIVTGCLIIGFGLLGMIFMIIKKLISLQPFLVFSPIFMIGFGGMLLALEFNIGFILDNFGFLKSLLGRGIFNIYLSTQVFYYFSCGDQASYVLAWVTSMILFGIGILYVILHFAGRNAKKEGEV